MRTILISIIHAMCKHTQKVESPCQDLFDPARPIPAERLMSKRDKIQIEYKGQIYTLSQTRNDKLILTK